MIQVRRKLFRTIDGLIYKGEEVQRLQDYENSHFTEKEAKDWNRIKSIVNSVNVYCTYKEWNSFAVNVIMADQHYEFILDFIDKTIDSKEKDFILIKGRILPAKIK
jgi:hypothetical protein